MIILENSVNNIALRCITINFQYLINAYTEICNLVQTRYDNFLYFNMYFTIFSEKTPKNFSKN